MKKEGNELFEIGDLVYDIGANVGQSAKKFIDAGAGRVVCVEPCIENYVELVKFANTQDRLVVPIHGACGSFCIGSLGTFRLALNQHGLSTGCLQKWSTIYPDTEWGEPQFAVMYHLNFLNKMFGWPTYIKVDVEGAEFQVLEGLGEKPKFLTFEFHGKAKGDAIECLKLLKQRGFTKACYITEDVDLSKLPDREINEVMAEFEAAIPNWGNVTVG